MGEIVKYKTRSRELKSIKPHAQRVGPSGNEQNLHVLRGFVLASGAPTSPWCLPSRM